MAKPPRIQFADLNDQEVPSTTTDVTGHSNKKKQFDNETLRSSHGYVSELSRSLKEIDDVKNKAVEYDKKVDDGLIVVELDHDKLDFSFVRDRIDVAQTNISDLAEDIRANGQQSPILVRPHPDDSTRYQIVYGHRRYLATKRIGVPVKALVRNVSDQELVVIQGRENNSRENLSFIEKALFALAIKSQGYAHDVIMNALNISSPQAYRYIKTAEQLSSDIICRIGPAPSIGRRPWMELSEIIEPFYDEAIKSLDNPDITELNSDDRFHALLKIIRNLHERRLASTLSDNKAQNTNEEPVVTMVTNSDSGDSSERVWKSKREDLVAEGRANQGTYLLQFNKPKATQFGSWLTSKLDRLYEEFEKEKKMK